MDGTCLDGRSRMTDRTLYALRKAAGHHRTDYRAQSGMYPSQAGGGDSEEDRYV